jgi:hypothetical protein
MSSFYQPCPTSGLSMSMPIGVLCWVSSTMSVGLLGVIFGDGILSTLMTFHYVDGCCSSPRDCICSLVLNLGYLEVWFGSTCLVGAMVVVNYHSTSSVASTTFVIFATFPLYCLFSIALYLLYFHNNIFLLRPHFVWASCEACLRCYLFYGFNEPLVPSHFPLLSLSISSWRD